MNVKINEYLIILEIRGYALGWKVDTHGIQANHHVQHDGAYEIPRFPAEHVPVPVVTEFHRFSRVTVPFLLSLDPQLGTRLEEYHDIIENFPGGDGGPEIEHDLHRFHPMQVSEQQAIEGHTDQQIYKDKRYSYLDDVKDVKFIIDCGGYIGLKSIWFLNRYPDTFLITVEPDPDNFLICAKNLQFYKKRARLVRSAIWPHKTGLVISKGHYRDGLDWSTQVRESGVGEKPDIYSIDLETLIKESGYNRVDILKIDIERTEIELFSHGYNHWPDRVRNI